MVEGLFIPFLLLAFTSAAIFQKGNDRTKRWYKYGIAVLSFFVLLISFLRESRLIKYNQINNIYLLLGVLILGLAFAVLTCLYIVRNKKNFALEVAQAATGLLFNACVLLFEFPVVAALPHHFRNMDESYFTTMMLMKVTGYIFGLLVCFLAIPAGYKVANRSSKKAALFLYTSSYLVYGFISFVAIVGIINSYYRRKIKIPLGLRKSIPQLITAENLIYFVVLVILIIFSIYFILHFFKIYGEYSNPAQHRRLKMISRNNRRWGLVLLALSIFTWIDMTAIKKAANTLVELSPAEEYQIEGNQIFIPLEQISDGHLHRFAWVNEKGTEIRFIVIQKKGTNFGVGFDACEVCGSAGYYERKDEVICNRCDVVMNKNTIGLKGGCNPIPLHSRIADGGLIVLTDDLNLEAKRF